MTAQLHAWKLSSISPRMLAHSLEEARDFYKILGFELDSEYNEGSFFILSRDGVSIHFNVDDARPSLLEGRRNRRGSVCWIGVEHGIEALHEACRAGGLVSKPLQETDFGFKQFFVNDPYGNLVLIAQPVSQSDAGRARERG
jgi:catechol 2,3-dioxygenase-like lactoylglutathione lyase family enzyme